MIKRINLARFICRSLYLNEKCRILASPVSTSAIHNYKTEVKDFLSSKKEFVEEERKRYEDTFGDLDSFGSKYLQVKDDPEDIVEYERAKAAPGKSVFQYIQEVKRLLSNNDYKGALRLLEVDMRNDRIRETRFIYKLLLCYNARQGNLKEAYRLFIDYKKRQGLVTGAIYTSMFNTCANCSDSFLALKKADAVRECMYRNEFHVINMSNYNVMLKAYGRHGDINTCFKIIDEVLSKRNKVNSKTYTFLLQACVSDRNSGLRHALLVWRKMLQYKTKPCIYAFNTMLRCIRDCSLGEISLIPQVIEQVMEESKYFYKRKLKIQKIGSEEKIRIVKIPSDGSNLLASAKNESESQEQAQKDFINLESIQLDNQKLLPSEKDAETSEIMVVEGQTESYVNNFENKDESVESCSSAGKSMELVHESEVTSQSDFELPNLLSLKPTTGSVVEFNSMTSPQHRFMLVGGVKGFLKTMDEFGVKPDLKTFTLLLSLIPGTVEAEEELISLVESYNIKFDTGFFNVLLKSRICRNDDYLIKDCLERMYNKNLKPDILTFGILAISCYTHELGIELLENIHKHGFRVNAEIVGTLLKKANAAKDMKYILTILRAAREDKAELSPRCLAEMSYAVRERKRRNRLEKVISSDKDNYDENDTLLSLESESRKEFPAQA